MESKSCNTCTHKTVCTWSSDRTINCQYYREGNNKTEHDYFSIIKWNNDFTHYLPKATKLLVIVKDTHGDNVNYYTQVAWVVYDESNTNLIWISDNEQIFDEVILWAHLPEYETFNS